MVDFSEKRPSKKKCCVPGCTDKDSSRFRFPNKKEMDKVALWLEAINCPRLFNFSFDKLYINCVVCAQHFPEDQLLHGTRRGVKTTAVPSLNLPPRNQGDGKI